MTLRTACLVAAACALLAAAPAGATLPGANGKIVFTAYEKLYTVNPDGSGLAPITRAPEDEKYDVAPVWSPDGTRIATSGKVLEPPLPYLGSRHWSDNNLEVFGADGSGFTRFDLPNQHFNGHAAWSPGGTRLVYHSDRLGNGSIHTVRADGTDAKLVVEGTYGESNFQPDWSPDGKWIVFARDEGSERGSDLWLVRPDGSELHKLLTRPGFESNPSWSPDGQWVVFSGGTSNWFYGGRESIYVVSSSGGEPKQLTTGDHDVSPVWSPDGTAIAFERSPIIPEGTDERRVWVMNADGSNPHAITDRCGGCEPDWQRVAPFGYTPPDPEDPPRDTTVPQLILRIGGPPTSYPRPATPKLERIAKLRLTPARFKWRDRSAARVSFALATPTTVTFTVNRAGRQRVLRTVEVRFAAGDGSAKLAQLLPRKLAPGLYRIRAISARNAVSGTFRVLRP